MAKEYRTPAILSEQASEMTADEARAYRKARYQAPAPAPLSEQQKREAFRIFWAQAKSQYGQPKNLEQVLWLHLKSTKQDEPSKFEAGVAHFGLKKIK